MEFAGTADGPVEEPLKYAWRLDGGAWSEPTGQAYADLEFIEAGPHRFEVLSIGPMANLDTTPAAMTLDVTLPVPEVRIVSSPQGVVTDLDVAIVCEIVKRPEGSEATLQWRVDDGPWQDTRETVVRLPGLADGVHVFEVRGVGDGRYLQAPPASATFTVKVDYDKAIDSALEGLRSTDYGQREVAARRLVSLGERCVPRLKEQLALPTKTHGGGFRPCWRRSRTDRNGVEGPSPRWRAIRRPVRKYHAPVFGSRRN